MQKRFDLVIFDADGTLIDNRHAIRSNFNYARQAHGYPPLPESEIDAMIGTPLVEMYERTLPETDRNLAPQMAKMHAELYLTNCDQGIVILGGAVSTLEYLRWHGFKSAVATTKSTRGMQHLFQKIGLYDRFDMVVGVQDGIKPKPHPDMIYYILEQLQIEKQRAILVGDTPTDIETARNSGIPVIAITSGTRLGTTTLDKLYEANPDAMINSLAELSDHLFD